MRYLHTRWKQISRQLQYFIDRSQRPVVITDNGNPPSGRSRIRRATGIPPEDYAIVTRVLNPYTHAMLVEIDGIAQYGTDAASEVVTNRDVMAEALRGARPCWPFQTCNWCCTWR